ncbi:L-serine ammonia-lyase, iron-sulfur-dependent subunit beta [uncultured Ruthenibacterium sp.]|uniref:L-serine ammonia-lyase, iron-sulfur-dependent subunit beta n=1 Tax=uncultured Ruthenibacterium sp. TaxID=1905347 RepID=UPI00349E592C
MDVFDIIGPVMIGPSSSHTAGAARIGRIARALLGEKPVRAQVGLHGSFAKTYKGHGTDRAIAGGILGMEPDDERIRDSLSTAIQEGLDITFSPIHLDDAHPNTALITLTGESGRQIQLQGASVGGGSIHVTQVNGMAVDISGEHTTLIVLHKDAPGTIAAVTEELSLRNVNICNFRLARAYKGGTAVMTIEVDGTVDTDLNGCVEKLPNVLSSTMLLPV